RRSRASPPRSDAVRAVVRPSMSSVVPASATTAARATGARTPGTVRDRPAASSAASRIAGRARGGGMAACPAVVDATAERRTAAARLPPRIAFVGFGLIGGSIAMALREAGYRGSLAAWTPNGAGPAEGLRRGIVDDAP